LNRDRSRLGLNMIPSERRLPLKDHALAWPEGRRL
jgi:hypothetical protein